MFLVACRQSFSVIRIDPLTICPSPHALNPVRMVEIPTHCLPQPFFKSFRRLPSKLDGQFACINRITPVVARPILHICDQSPPAYSCRSHLIHQVADSRYYINIGSLAITTHVVCLTGLTRFKNCPDCRSMILYKQPVANIFAIAVNWERLPFKRI